MKDIKYGITHGQAYCRDCSWEDYLRMEKNGMRNFLRRIKDHAGKMGHRITIETCSSREIRG